MKASLGTITDTLASAHVAWVEVLHNLFCPRLQPLTLPPFTIVLPATKRCSYRMMLVGRCWEKGTTGFAQRGGICSPTYGEFGQQYSRRGPRRFDGRRCCRNLQQTLCKTGSTPTLRATSTEITSFVGPGLTRCVPETQTLHQGEWVKRLELEVSGKNRDRVLSFF